MIFEFKSEIDKIRDLVWCKGDFIRYLKYLYYIFICTYKHYYNVLLRII